MPQHELGFTPLTEDQAKAAVSLNNPRRAFAQFVGNDRAKKVVSRAIFAALQRRNHSMGESNFSIIGNSGAGKTKFVSLVAQEVGLPFVTIQPQRVKTVNDVLVAISEVCDKTLLSPGDSRTLELQPVRKNHFVLPSMIVFIDEVHLLKSKLSQALLKATEPKDRMLVTETGWTADCRDVCWIVATTDRGLLFDAFDTRFVKIPMLPYTLQQIAQIVKQAYPAWSNAICEEIARYGGRNARETLALAKDIELEGRMNGGVDFAAVNAVREEHGIDRFGMTEQRVEILKALQDGPVSKQRLCYAANCKLEELERYVLPVLETSTPDLPSCIAVCSRGCELTQQGIEELQKRRLLK